MPNTRSLILTLTALIVVVGMCISPMRAEDEGPIRPVKAMVQEAKKVVRKIKRNDRTVINALRIILNRPQDAQRLPFWRQNELVPGLGYTKIAEGASFPKWLSLRLAAAIRGGHPFGYEMKKEINTFFDAKLDSRLEVSSAAVELLVCSEINNRSDDAAKPFKEKAAKRAAEISQKTKWPTRDFKTEPEMAQLAEHVSDLFARRLLRANQWQYPADLAGPRIAQVAAFTLENAQGKGALWFGIDGGREYNYADGTKKRIVQDQPHAQGVLLLLMAHSLAAELQEPEQPAYSLRPYRSILQAHVQEIVRPISQLDVVKRVQSGATAFFTGTIEESLLLFAGEKKPLKGRIEEIREAALPTPVSLYQLPNPLDFGMASLLGWLERVTLANAGTANINDHDDRNVRISLAILAKTGGLFTKKPVTALFDEEEFKSVLDGITTLERSENPLTFEERVNRAVTNAADWLVKQQTSNFTFPGQFQNTPGGQALSLLALLDADVSRDSPVIRNGIKWLRGKNMQSPTYASGIILMMLQKFYEREEEDAGMLDARTPEQYKLAQGRLWKVLPAEDRKWIDDLVKLLTEGHFENEGWGYGRGAANEQHRDNSNSQYAILGLKAASILGAEFKRDVFLLEANRFIADYWTSNMAPIKVKRRDADEKKDEGGTEAKSKAIPDIVPGGWGYIGGKASARTLSMSAAGISSIVICRDELKLAGKLSDELDIDLLRHVQGACYQLGIAYPYQRPATLEAMPARSDGFGTFYDMYSVERAGVLADEEKLKDVQWYLEGANILIDAQAQDGSWPVMAGKTKYETCNHCFAILFLKRAAIHIADRPRKGPITHGPEKK